MRRKLGFTLVELVVVISVVAVLVGLLMPAVQRAREAARRSTCRNNLKQIGLALHDYENVNRVLPPSCTGDMAYGVWYPNPAQFRLQSWTSMLLPFLDQRNLWNEIDFSLSALDERNLDAATHILSVFRCPTFNGPDYSQCPLYTALSPQGPRGDAQFLSQLGARTTPTVELLEELDGLSPRLVFARSPFSLSLQRRCKPRGMGNGVQFVDRTSRVHRDSAAQDPSEAELPAHSRAESARLTRFSEPSARRSLEKFGRFEGRPRGSVCALAA